MTTDHRPVAQSRQVPAAGEVLVDHVAHFVPDIARAADSLGAMGFTLTPFSAQRHRADPDGPVVDAGTGNRCVMLGEGYLEFLTPTGDTPVARRISTAIARYVGVHLICFGTSEPAAVHRRLKGDGFDPQPPLELERLAGSASGGEAKARFTVLRVAPDAMPEGRIQFVTHRTPDVVWQDRWIRHDNGAVELRTVYLCVSDPVEVAHRYARFAGLAVDRRDGALMLRAARGELVVADRAWCAARLAGAPPLPPPWIAGYALAFADGRQAVRRLAAGGAEIVGDVARLGPELGGRIVIVDRRRRGTL